jgi:alpha-tubulin suppressor-like RCC1 family protein
MNGGMKCWGRNDLGQLGNGSVTNSSVPVTVLNAEGSAALSGVSTASSSYHTCAVMGDSGAMCWGNNYWGQLGSPDLDQSWLPTDVLVSSGGSRLTNVTAIKTISGYTTCALMSDSGVKCWGKNYYGQLGNGTGGAGLKSMVPVDVLTGGAVD